MKWHPPACFAVTALALVALLKWVPVIGFVSILGPIDPGRIRQLFPHHLVNPDGVQGGADLFDSWLALEIKTRASMVGIAWLGLVAVIWHQEKQQRRRAAGGKA